MLRLGVCLIFILEVLDLERIIHVDLFNWGVQILVLQERREIALVIVRVIMQGHFRFTFLLGDQQVQTVFHRPYFFDQQFRRLHLLLSVVFGVVHSWKVDSTILLFEAIVIEPLPSLYLLLSVSIVEILVNFDIVSVPRTWSVWLLALYEIYIGCLVVLLARSGILVRNGALVGWRLYLGRIPLIVIVDCVQFQVDLILLIL